MTERANSRNDPELPPLAELFRTAAAIVRGQAAAEGPSWDLLARLGYLDDAADQAPHHAAILLAAARFTRIFSLDSDDTPGLTILGAEADPSNMGLGETTLKSFAGAGLTFRAAFEACVGEGVERLSQYITDQDVVKRLTAEEALVDVPPPIRELWHFLTPYRRDSAKIQTAWTSAADLANGRLVLLPADICFRRPNSDRDIDPPWPLSIGCSAHPNLLSATVLGLLELIEHDAISLWWRGGRRARSVPSGVGENVLAQLRGRATKRRTWFLDITNDCQVPVVVAASCHDDGFGLCCGFAARPTIAAAADAAARELGQMELASYISLAKYKAHRDENLNVVDRQHIQRFTTVDVMKTLALQPLAPPRPSCDLPTSDARTSLLGIRTRLAALGLTPYALDLTRSLFGIPVVRAICPHLEIGMRSAPGPRLIATAMASGTNPNDILPL